MLVFHFCISQLYQHVLSEKINHVDTEVKKYSLITTVTALRVNEDNLMNHLVVFNKLKCEVDNFAISALQLYSKEANLNSIRPYIHCINTLSVLPPVS